ncbi:hypothetical protein MMC11_006644 [Xylographa trunciseda]|nr:hypothetical protein [Xylographa trunciseda]
MVNRDDNGDYTGITVTGPTVFTVTTAPHGPDFSFAQLPAFTTITTYTKTLDKGTLQLEVADGYSFSTVTLVGPTTYVATVVEGFAADLCPIETGDITADPSCAPSAATSTIAINSGNFPMTTTISTPSNTSTYTETFTDTASGSNVVDFDDGFGDYTELTVSGLLPNIILSALAIVAIWARLTTNYIGPTVITETFVDQYTYTPKVYVDSTIIETVTLTVDEGNIILDVASDATYFVTTIEGPTTAILTVTAEMDERPIRAGYNSSDPHCTIPQTYDYAAEQSGHQVNLRTLLTVLSSNQVITTQLNVGSYSTTLQNFTFMGPSSIYSTSTANFDNILFGPDAYFPGNVCGGMCGMCNIFFPTVFVYYWPVSSQNTACLVTGNSTSATSLVKRYQHQSGIPVKARGLSAVTAGVSTLVNSDGFTFTSPSVYIAFPTISAFDNCGVLGPVHYNVTRSYPPDQISTLVFPETTTPGTYQFDFADAVCPPSSLNNQFWTVVGVNGGSAYDPVIAPPADLTLIDPQWNANCFAAPFQGSDPPYALEPAPNLDPSPTSLSPTLVAAADPASGVPSIPVQTPRPTNTIFSPETATNMIGNPKSSSFAVAALPSSTPVIVNQPSSAGRQSVSVQQPPTVVTLNGQTITADASSAFIVGSQTLTPGGIITLSGTPVSLPSSGGYIIQGSSTIPLIPTAPPLPLALTYVGNTYAADPITALIIEGKTLIPGGVITLSGTPISLPISASYIIQGTKTIPLYDPTPSRPPILTLGGSIYTANALTGFTIAGQTLSPGGVITFSGTPFSLATNGGYLIQGSSTLLLASVAPEILTLGTALYTANSASAFLIAGQTLTPGGLLTIAGTTISLDGAATAAVVGSSTEALGGFIASAFGGPRPTGSGITEFEGGVEKLRVLGMLGTLVAVGWLMAWMG